MAQPFTSTKSWINLSSTDRTSGTNNDFTINFNNSALSGDPGGFFGSKTFINPIFFSLPNNWQNIQLDYNDTFYIAGTGFPAGGSAVKITPAVYQNVSQITTELTTRIATALTGAGITGTITVSQETSPSNINCNYIKFVSASLSTPVSLYFNIATPVIPATNPYNFAGIIGCDENVFTLTANDTHILTQLPNLVLYDMIQINCNLCRSTYEIINSTGGKPILSPSIIMVSFPTANYLTTSQVVFNNNNPFLYRQEMKTANWDTIQIQICDKNGRLIPYFGELDFSMTIEREQYNEPVNLSFAKDQNPWTASMFYK
tara:strand:+ start:3038 stop:3985 length:948 start_codon:yes stop_codon:yes gene_type:complete